MYKFYTHPYTQLHNTNDIAKVSVPLGIQVKLNFSLVRLSPSSNFTKALTFKVLDTQFLACCKRHAVFHMFLVSSFTLFQI